MAADSRCGGEVRLQAGSHKYSSLESPPLLQHQQALPVLAGYVADAGSARLPPTSPPPTQAASTPRRLRSRGPVREFTPKPSRFRLEAERKSMSPRDALDPIACRSVNPVVKQILRGNLIALIFIAPLSVSARDSAACSLGI